jgi:hypothetical protein
LFLVGASLLLWTVIGLSILGVAIAFHQSAIAESAAGRRKGPVAGFKSCRGRQNPRRVGDVPGSGDAIAEAHPISRYAKKINQMLATNRAAVAAHSKIPPILARLPGEWETTLATGVLARRAHQNR